MPKIPQWVPIALRIKKKKKIRFYNSLKCCLRQCPLQPLLMHGCGHTDLVPIFSNVIKTSFRRAFVHGTSLSGMFFPHVADLAVASSMCFAPFPKWAVVLGGRGGGGSAWFKPSGSTRPCCEQAGGSHHAAEDGSGAVQFVQNSGLPSNVGGEVPPPSPWV